MTQSGRYGGQWQLPQYRRRTYLDINLLADRIILCFIGVSSLGKKSASKKTIQEATSFSLERLNTEISDAEYYWNNGGTSQGRRAFFKKLVSLESLREDLFDIPTPSRRHTR